MTRRSLNLTDPLYAYLCEVSLREPPVLARLRRGGVGVLDSRFRSGLSGESYDATKRAFGVSYNFNSSCPAHGSALRAARGQALCQASTPLLVTPEDVDGRVKPGQGEKTCLPIRFPDTDSRAFSRE